LGGARPSKQEAGRAPRSSYLRKQLGMPTRTASVICRRSTWCGGGDWWIVGLARGARWKPPGERNALPRAGWCAAAGLAARFCSATLAGRDDYPIPLGRAHAHDQKGAVVRRATADVPLDLGRRCSDPVLRGRRHFFYDDLIAYAAGAGGPAALPKAGWVARRAARDAQPRPGDIRDQCSGP